MTQCATAFSTNATCLNRDLKQHHSNHSHTPLPWNTPLARLGLHACIGMQSLCRHMHATACNMHRGCPQLVHGAAASTYCAWLMHRCTGSCHMPLHQALHATVMFIRMHHAASSAEPGGCLCTSCTQRTLHATLPHKQIEAHACRCAASTGSPARHSSLEQQYRTTLSAPAACPASCSTALKQGSHWLGQR